MLFLSEEYRECFALASAVGTDRAFDREQQQIYKLLTVDTSADPKPDSCACICKVALALQDAPIKVPHLRWNVGMYIARLREVSVECRLSEQEEHWLLQHVVHSPPAPEDAKPVGELNIELFSALIDNRIAYLSYRFGREDAQGGDAQGGGRILHEEEDTFDSRWFRVAYRGFPSIEYGFYDQPIE